MKVYQEIATLVQARLNAKIQDVLNGKARKRKAA